MTDDRSESTHYRVFDDALTLSEKVERIGRKRFGELTGRQAMFLAMVRLFEERPSLGDVARRARCSHQNAKTVLSALHKKGFLDFYLDKRDQRVLRIHLTEKGEVIGAQALQELDKLLTLIEGRVEPEAAEVFSDVTIDLSKAFDEVFLTSEEPQEEADEA